MSLIVSLRPCLDDIDPDQLSAIFHNLLLLNDEERERERGQYVPLSRKAAVSINEDNFSIRTTS